MCVLPRHGIGRYPWLLIVSVVVLTGCPIDSPRVGTEVDAPRQSEVQKSPERAQLGTTESQTIHGKVIAVLDGDTIDILDADLQKTRIRFHGIDAPENGQPFGRNAKQFVSERIAGKQIEVFRRDVDRYGRTIGDIVIDGERLTVEIVRAGLAWHYVQYAPDDSELAKAESDARSAFRGLWSDKRHVPPWEWRRLSKEERDRLR